MAQNRTLLKKGSSLLGLEVTQEQEDMLVSFLDNVLEENKRFNLTGIKDLNEATIKHLLDSLSLAQYITKGLIVDVGSGAGFPGIPLAIIKPECSFILMEAKKKKANFIAAASQELGLKNTRVVDLRSEETVLEEKADVIVSRALGSLDYFIEKTKHMLKKGGKLYAMKGKKPIEEIKHINKRWCVAQIKKIDVPYLEADRHIITLTRKK